MKQSKKTASCFEKTLITPEFLETRALLSTIYVDCDAPGEGHDGSSWALAYTDLQTALSAAVSGDQIHVADGTYKPTAGTDRTQSFVLKNGVGLQGGYAGNGADNPDARDPKQYSTILSGDIGASGDDADNSYHVVSANQITNSATLDGFTITLGNANRQENPDTYGGGIYCFFATPSISNCILINNKAKNGGGIALVASSLTITQCAFTNNTGTSVGGGIFSHGSAPTVSQSSFTENNSSGGGAMYISSQSSMSIDHCEFTRNIGSTQGGALDLVDSSVSIKFSTFLGNTAQEHSGGALNLYQSTADMTNCIFVKNSAEYGGCIQSGTSETTAKNCTFYLNSSSGQGDAIYNLKTLNLNNCILWGSDKQLFCPITQPSVFYCDIQEGYSGTGNISADPKFVRDPSAGNDGVWGTSDDDYGDLKIKDDSPCIDNGSNAALPTEFTTDLAGNSRFFDNPIAPNAGQGTAPIVDMGAYENHSVLSSSITGSVFNDLDADGVKDKTEKALAKVKLFLDANGNGKFDAGEKTVSTDSNGKYAFLLLASGNYRVRLVAPPAGFRLSGPAIGSRDVSPAPGATVSGRDFLVTQLALVKGTVFLDANKNKTKDLAEKGLKGRRIFIDLDNDGAWDKNETSVLTDSNGNFSINLKAGKYTLKVLQPKGAQFTNPAKGSISLTLKSGNVLTGKNFGMTK